MNFPLMTRKVHEKILSDTKNSCAMRIQDKNAEHKRELEKVCRDLKEIVGNLSRISIVRSHEDNKWRIVVDFNPMVFAHALERGNDDYYIEMIADQFKYEIARKVMECNIKRPEEVNLGRKLRMVS